MLSETKTYTQCTGKKKAYEFMCIFIYSLIYMMHIHILEGHILD